MTAAAGFNYDAPKHPIITERILTTISEHQHTVNQNILSEVAELRERVTFLESEIARLEQLYAPEVIELREIGREQAKAEIVELFDQTESPLYYSDIEERLRIDVELVVEICHELLDEGVIGLDAYNAV